MKSGQKDQNQAQKRILALTDHDLLAMLKAPAHEYTPFALDVAREELARRGGRETLEARISEQTVQQEAAAEKARLAISKGLCPRCEKSDIRRHSGCATPLVLAIAWIGFSVALPLLMPHPGAVGIAFLAFVYGTCGVLVLITATSALFGRHKCRACGHKWR